MMKYIIVDTFYASSIPIIFDECVEHAQMAKSVPGVQKVISAGFVAFGVDEEGYASPHCHGKSISLNIKSRTEDSTIVKRSMMRY